jgi:hypothetical protein
MTDATRGAGTLTFPEHLSSPKVLSGVHVTLSLVLCVCFVDRCLSFFNFSFRPLYCLFFLDIWILITPLVSSCKSNYYTNTMTAQKLYFVSIFFYRLSIAHWCLTLLENLWSDLQKKTLNLFYSFSKVSMFILYYLL